MGLEQTHHSNRNSVTYLKTSDLGVEDAQRLCRCLIISEFGILPETIQIHQRTVAPMM